MLGYGDENRIKFPTPLDPVEIAAIEDGRCFNRLLLSLLDPDGEAGREMEREKKRQLEEVLKEEGLYGAPQINLKFHQDEQGLYHTSLF